MASFRYLGWCLYLGRRQTLRYETKEWTPFLRAVELPYAHHHWPPARCHLLQAAIVARGTKLRPPEKSRAPRKTLKEVPVPVLSRDAPPLRVSRLEVAVGTACVHSFADKNEKMPPTWVALPTREFPSNAEDNPQLLAPSAAQNCSTISSHLQHLNTARRPLQLVPQSCQFPGCRSSAEKNWGGTSPGLTPAGSPEWLSPSPTVPPTGSGRRLIPAQGA